MSLNTVVYAVGTNMDETNGRLNCNVVYDDDDDFIITTTIIIIVQIFL
jgi:hypothetical protein